MASEMMHCAPRTDVSTSPVKSMASEMMHCAPRTDGQLLNIRLTSHVTKSKITDRLLQQRPFTLLHSVEIAMFVVHVSSDSHSAEKKAPWQDAESS